MSPMKRRLIEDRAIRDAAREVVNREVAWFKAGAGEPGFAAHVLATGKDYAGTVAEGAMDLARDNRGRLSGGLALATIGLAAWLYRGQLGDLVTGIFQGLTGTHDEADGAMAEPSIPTDSQQES